MYCNSLRNEVVESGTINTFKNRFNKHWSNEEVLFDFSADLTDGTGGQYIINVFLSRCGHRGLPAPA